MAARDRRELTHIPRSAVPPRKSKPKSKPAPKALQKYAKENSQFTFKAGIVEGRVIDIKAISDLASMPPKEEIYAKLLYVINAPAQGLVTAMNGVGRNLAVVVDQGVKEGKFKD